MQLNLYHLKHKSWLLKNCAAGTLFAVRHDGEKFGT